MTYENIYCLEDDTCRYVLRKEGNNPLVVMAINPSTADANHKDSTTSFIMGIAERFGFDSFIIINVYPYRATNFDKLPYECDYKIHYRNIKEIYNVLSNLKNPTLLIAYGNHISDRKYLRGCFNDILKRLSSLPNIEYVQLGDLTQSKNPRHPLYAPASLTLKPYLNL